YQEPGSSGYSYGFQQRPSQLLPGPPGQYGASQRRRTGARRATDPRILKFGRRTHLHFKAHESEVFEAGSPEACIRQLALDEGRNTALLEAWDRQGNSSMRSPDQPDVSSYPYVRPSA